MIADSNILIYAFLAGNRALRSFISNRLPAVSAITYVEVYGYHRLTIDQASTLRQLFSDLTILPLDQRILDEAVALRQQRRMDLGDALIAATALVHHKTLVTRNIADFEWVTGLRLLDPFASESGREIADD